MAEHSKLPWQAKKLLADGLVIRREGWEITTPEYDVCANIQNGAPIRKEEDAAYIVLACNAHPRLVEALEQAHEALKKVNTSRASINESVMEIVDGARDAARAVLADIRRAVK